MDQFRFFPPPSSPKSILASKNLNTRQRKPSSSSIPFQTAHVQHVQFKEAESKSNSNPKGASTVSSLSPTDSVLLRIIQDANRNHSRSKASDQDVKENRSDYSHSRVGSQESGSGSGSRSGRRSSSSSRGFFGRPTRWASQSSGSTLVGSGGSSHGGKRSGSISSQRPVPVTVSATHTSRLPAHSPSPVLRTGFASPRSSSRQKLGVDYDDRRDSLDYEQNNNNNNSWHMPQPNRLLPPTSPIPGIDEYLSPTVHDEPGVPADMQGSVDKTSNSDVKSSSAREMEMLWEAANGRRTEGLMGTLNLKMNRPEPARFTFGNPQFHPIPFYTLHKHSDSSELLIVRTNPSNTTDNHPVTLLDLSGTNSTYLHPHVPPLPPNNDLITLIFPQQAAIAAIDQAEQRTRSHPHHHRYRLSEPIEETRANAINRARTQESTRLTWNSDRGVYELQHPALFSSSSSSSSSSMSRPFHQQLAPDPPALIGADGVGFGIALSPVPSSRPSGALIITISGTGSVYGSRSGSSSRTDSARYQKTTTTSTTSPPTITVSSSSSPLTTAEYTYTGSSSTTSLNLIPTPGALTSTSTTTLANLNSSLNNNHNDNDNEPLASLNLENMTLSLCPGGILEAFPSPHAVDSVVAAVLAVAVSDSLTRRFLEGVDVCLGLDVDLDADVDADVDVDVGVGVGVDDYDRDWNQTQDQIRNGIRSHLRFQFPPFSSSSSEEKEEETWKERNQNQNHLQLVPSPGPRHPPQPWPRPQQLRPQTTTTTQNAPVYTTPRPSSLANTTNANTNTNYYYNNYPYYYQYWNQTNKNDSNNNDKKPKTPTLLTENTRPKLSAIWASLSLSAQAQAQEREREREREDERLDEMDEMERGAIVPISLATRTTRTTTTTTNERERDAKEKEKEKEKAKAKTKTKAKGKTRNKIILLDEVDLERYGRFGPGSRREGQALPLLSRGLLAVLFWWLEVVVWGLMGVVSGLAWVVVVVSRVFG